MADWQARYLRAGGKAALSVHDTLEKKRVFGDEPGDTPLASTMHAIMTELDQLAKHGLASCQELVD